MQTLNTILNIVLIVLSIAMIAVVLMQQSKSAGLGSAFGGDTQSFTARGQKAEQGGQASAHHQDTCSCNRRDRYCHGYNKLIKGKNVTLGRAAKVCPCFCAKKTKEKLKNNLEIKKRITDTIAETGRPMSAEDIYKSMTDNGGEIQIEEIKLALKELSRDGRVIITRRGKAALPEQLGLIYGRIQGNGRGFGFFIPADGSGDLFIAAEDMNGALHGDTVWVRKLTGSPGAGTTGELWR